MGKSPVTPDLDEWDGALGPQSADEPLFYELQIGEGGVRLFGPSPGQRQEYDRKEFETLVTEGEWILANHHPEKDVYQTPDGDWSY